MHMICFYYEEHAVMLPIFRNVAGFDLIPGCMKNFNLWSLRVFNIFMNK
jgi:hypothetical protein